MTDPLAQLDRIEAKRDEDHRTQTATEGEGEAMSPKRIQLRRTKGWRKPAGTVVVSRPSKWGNPFRVEERHGWWYVFEAGDDRGVGEHRTKAEAVAEAVALFRGMFADRNRHDREERKRRAVEDLRGRDLACWCKPGDPCHAAGCAASAAGARRHFGCDRRKARKPHGRPAAPAAAAFARSANSTGDLPDHPSRRARCRPIFRGVRRQEAGHA